MRMDCKPRYRLLSGRVKALLVVLPLGLIPISSSSPAPKSTRTPVAACGIAAGCQPAGVCPELLPPSPGPDPRDGCLLDVKPGPAGWDAP
jgi:hypothetical protein